jgi:hypothetical protein
VGQSIRIGEKREGDDGVVEFVGTKGGVGGGGLVADRTRDRWRRQCRAGDGSVALLRVEVGEGAQWVGVRLLGRHDEQ